MIASKILKTVCICMIASKILKLYASLTSTKTNNCIVPVVSDWTVRWDSSQNERYGLPSPFRFLSLFLLFASKPENIWGHYCQDVNLQVSFSDT